MINLEGFQVVVSVLWYKITHWQALQKAIVNPTETTFSTTKEKIYRILENEWFPDFVVSPLYHACNGNHSFNTL
jgi:hypothetical protein